MWLSVAFPTCPRCRSNSNQCYHKDCRSGARKPMEIDSDTSMVRCPSCGQSWHIKESNYYCTCDYVFSAYDVEVEIDAIVANAKLIAQEIRRTAATRARINALTTRDIELKAQDTIKKTFGAKIWEALKDMLPAIVAAVKAWLGV